VVIRFTFFGTEHTKQKFLLDGKFESDCAFSFLIVDASRLDVSQAPATLSIAVSEPHKASLAPSFNKELSPVCYENLMAAIAEALPKPNQVPAARFFVQADAGARIDGPGHRRS
jgi:hypothetical protein